MRVDEKQSIFEVIDFVEKPNISLQKLLKLNSLLNTGIFLESILFIKELNYMHLIYFKLLKHHFYNQKGP